MKDDEARLAPRSQGCCKVGSGVDRLGGRNSACSLADCVSQQETRGGAKKGRELHSSEWIDVMPARASIDVWEKQRTRGK
jgi:hypothetical protein